MNGNQSDNSALSAGAAYVFVRSGTSWSQQAYLTASNTDAGDLFGLSVGISGDTVVVGARDEASSATGVNGDESDNSAAESGAAYVFVRSSRRNIATASTDRGSTLSRVVQTMRTFGRLAHKSPLPSLVTSME